MKKLLRPLDVFLLGLSGVATIFEEFKDPFDLMNSHYDGLKGWVHPRFRKRDYYQMTYNALRTGYIEKTIKNGKPYFCLTSKGKEKLSRFFSLNLMQSKKWDKKWRIVIFDIEETNKKSRESLRSKLRELGFGMIQESVWISPHDIIVDFREYIKEIGLGDQVFVMEVSGMLAGNEKGLVSKIWSLDKLNSKYEELYYALKKISDRLKISMGKGEGKKVKNELAECRNSYLQLLKDDPCLPKELLPENWYGEKVRELLKRLQ